MNNLNKETAILDEQQLKNLENTLNILSNIEKHLSSIAYSLDYFVFDNKRTVDKSHSIPD